MTPFLLRVTRTAFAIGEQIAPRLTGYVAFRLFCRTSNPRKQTEGERNKLVETEHLMINARRHWLTTALGRIAAYEFRPQQWRRSYPTVLVVHGWQSRSEHMAALAQSVAGKGYRVIAIDLPGHGNSSGRQLDLLRAVAAVNEAAMWFGPFVAGIGHSFGSAVLVAALDGAINGFASVPFGRLVLISAPAGMKPVFGQFAETIGLGSKSIGHLESHVQRLAGRPIEAMDVGDILRQHKIPVSVIHCRDDRELPHAHGRRIAEAGSHVTLMEMEGLGHRRIIAAPETHELVTGLLADDTRLAA